MNFLPACLVYTQDPELARRVTAYLKPVGAARCVDDAAGLELALAQAEGVVLVVDLLGEDSRRLLSRIMKNHTRTVVVALGMPGSDPAMEAEDSGVYEVASRDVDRRKLRSVFSRAQRHVQALETTRALEEELHEAPGEQTSGERHVAGDRLPVDLRSLSRAFRHVEDVDTMLENIAEGVASCAGVSRVGLFAVARGQTDYRLRAGIKCLAEVGELEVAAADPLVNWLQMNAHLVSRSTLVHVEERRERVLLSRTLDRLGAEVIVPLHGRRRLLGWLFVGRHVTGMPFGPSELERLSAVAEQVSSALENSLLYEEAAVQRTLAETLLHSIPAGIIALGANGRVRWFNRTAERLLEVTAEEILGQPAGRLGGRLGDLLMRCVAGEATDGSVELSDALTERALSVTTTRLTHEQQGFGAVAIVEDLTEARALRAKQQRLERAAFWQDLAAAIAHEVRGPLVAINTYFQLLPERHDDPEFRNQFSELVPREIARLNQMVEQINEYANPPELTFESISIDSVLDKAVASAKERLPSNGVPIKLSVARDVPRIEGDHSALVECFAHLVANAVEAVQETKKPSVAIKATGNGANGEERKVSVEVCDNGGGIPLDVSEKLFSPFCTRKARGIGLGLPIVKRTVTDHNGQVSIETGDTGTCVSVALPAAASEGQLENETSTRR